MQPDLGELNRSRTLPSQSTAGAEKEPANGPCVSHDPGILSSLSSPQVASRDLFWPKVGTIVASLQLARGTEEITACARQLAAFVAGREDREVVWDFVAEHGIPKGLRPQQRLEFARVILPLVSPEEHRSIQALVKMARQAVEIRHPELYKIAGERCLSVELDSEVMGELAGTFARYETHNVDREECLAPWSTLFVEKGDSNVLRACADEIQRRVERREFSSFDHLVGVLCRSHEAESKVVLRALVDRELQSEPSISRELADVAKATVREFSENLRPSMVLRRAILAAPIACLIEAVSNGTVAPQFTEAFARTLGIAAAWTVAAAYIKSRRRVDALIKKTDSERLSTQKENAYLESEAFLHLAEKVYKRLLDNQAQSAELRSILAAMESNPLFMDEIPRWKD